jgi:aspartate dehydrogenase
MMRVGFIGCGSIGGAAVRAIAEGRVVNATLAGIADLAGSDVARETAAWAHCPFMADVRNLLGLHPDLIVEAASQEAVRAWGRAVLEADADLMIVSVGALADAVLLAGLASVAEERGKRIYVPSGAIGGLDIIRSATVGGLQECRLTTTKPPQALAGAAGLRERGVDLSSVQSPTVVYEGPASEAVRLFPQNINVAAAISLAGIGLERTVVRIVADPGVARNVHEVFVRGAFGEATVRLENLPSPSNPRSSYLASLSVIAALQRISRPFHIGV